MLKLRPFTPLALLAIVFCIVVLWSNASVGYASDLTFRSVTISSAQPSLNVFDSFKFTTPSSTNLGSIVFEYCSNTPLFTQPCTAPTGLDLSTAILASQFGNTGFSIDSADSTSNKFVLSRTVAPAITTPSSYNFTNIINPSVIGTVFVRISTYTSQNGSGSYIDKGAVAFAIQNIFTVGTYVPPFLKLCVGIIVAPDCSSFSGDSIDLGNLSSTQANAGQSQFATGTNDPNGYNVYASGNTMTSGNNTIAQLNSPVPSFPGTPQFGINLRANLIPAIGQDPVGIGTGVPTANYSIQNRFIYNDGDDIASSPLPSDYNRMTVSYLVNVPKNQAPGIYSTTITFIAVVQF